MYNKIASKYNSHFPKKKKKNRIFGMRIPGEVYIGFQRMLYIYTFLYSLGFAFNVKE